jgi:serine/threonine-protein kinase RsbT
MDVMGECLSETTCRAVLAAAAAHTGIRGDDLTVATLPLYVDRIQRSLVLFGVDALRRTKCKEDLQRLAIRERETERPSPLGVEIITEQDIVRARSIGRETCRRLGFTDLNQIKVATAISELARNILQYAQTGSIRVRPLAPPAEGVEVVAADRGPGIADIEAVLGGRYRSRTGMGIGLLGVRRLMDSCDIQSKAGSGTVVTIRKLLAS